MQINGIVDKIYPTKQIKTKFGMKDKTGFVVATETDKVTVDYWGKVSPDLVAEEVSFNTKSREYEGKTFYTVDGDIRVVSSGGCEDEEPPLASVKKDVVKRSEMGREDFRADAEESVLKNLTSAKRVLLEVGVEPIGEAMVQLADLIGRTQTAITIDKKRG